MLLGKLSIRFPLKSSIFNEDKKPIQSGSLTILQLLIFSSVNICKQIFDQAGKGSTCGQLENESVSRLLMQNTPCGTKARFSQLSKIRQRRAIRFSKENLGSHLIPVFSKSRD